MKKFSFLFCLFFSFAGLTYAQQSNIPFIEEFPDATLDTTNWQIIGGTPEVTSVANTSSPPNALFISAETGQEILTSQAFNLVGFSGLVLAFYQSQLDVEAPEGVALEYLASTGTWQSLHQFLGSNNITPFELSLFPLPNDAYHSEFQFRFKAVGVPYSTPGFEGWYFDTIYLGDSTSFPASNIFYNPSDFEAAVSNLGIPTIIDFDDIETSPTDSNTYLNQEEFDGGFYADQGITFSNSNEFPLFIASGGQFWNLSNSLSVGRFPFDPAPNIFSEDDDLTITLTTPCVAIGFTLVDNITSTGEFVQFLSSSGDTIARVIPPVNFTPFRAFLGIISLDNPIAVINIVELANDWDDVNYDDFVFLIANETTVYNTQDITSRLSFVLHQNYPNPFNPATTIEFTLSQSGFVTLKVYNILGQEVTTLLGTYKHAGQYSVNFDASQLSSGIYYYTLATDDFKQTRKMVLLR
jgi:hypothetical protein